MKKVLVIFAILVVSAIVGACGGGTAGSSTTVRENVSNPAPVKAGTDQTSGGGGTAYGPTSTLPIAQGPKVIRQAQLAISVKSGAFDTTLTQVRSLVQLQGGFISGTDAQANPTTNESIRTGVVSFMVPADKFDDTIDQLSKMGRVQNEHISGQDVSAQYVDLQARLANAQAQRDAMIALLRKAQSVQDIIAVQTQLGQITEQIEQLKGQISYLDHNTTYSSISVSIAEVGAPAQTRSVDQWGFVTALGDSAHNFVTTINYILTGFGAIGPILILLGLGYLLWRRSGRPGLKHA